jgi:leader peptidase (prepilin peptidase)/N-methyltransferase
MSPQALWIVLAAILGLAVAPVSAALVERWPERPVLRRPLPPRGAGPRLLAAAGGCLSAGAAAIAGPGPRAMAAAGLASTLLPAVAVDLRRRLIPDVVVLPGAALALVLAGAEGPSRLLACAAAAGGAAAFVLLLWLIHPSGMGLGDVKLALLLGAALGASVLPALAVAFAAGGAVAAGLVAARGRRARGVGIPFAPFMAAGAAVALAWGSPMLEWWVAGMA